jgi:poly-gamma-glutamate capsule biosynthesis protein CapA/YwtB (metallophosphatase superfamily)
MNFDIVIAGDLYIGSHAKGRLAPFVDRREYKTLFGELHQVLRESSLSIVNLEGPLFQRGEPAAKTGPSLKMNPNVTHALTDAGVNLVTLANNHIMDFGTEGLRYTLNCLDNAGIESVGAGLNSESILKPFVTSVNARRVGVINICENEWITAVNAESGANGLDVVSSYYQITSLKKRTDLVIVIYHGGNEYHQLPSLHIKRLFRFFVDCGADAVVSHHTHVFSGWEEYLGKPIYFGIGNFIFDAQPFPKVKNWNYGMAIGLNISGSGFSQTIVPFRQNKGDVGVQLLKDTELEVFNEQFEDLSTVIKDDAELERRYEVFASSMTKQYESFLNPYTGKLAGLFKRGLLPNFLTANKKRLLLNLTRCESHREILGIILSDYSQGK